MKILLRRYPSIAVLVLLVGACTSGETLPETPSTTAAPVTTTTISPAPTTTETQGPCPSVFCVTYHLKPEATWSDGTPVTADDFVYTHGVFADPLATSDSGRGYQLIEGLEVVDAKTVVVGLSEVYGPWRTLFSTLLPAHIGDPADLTVTATAFRLADRIPGEEVTLVRNTNYWTTIDPLSGEPVGDVERLEFIAVPGARERIAALEDRVLDLIDPDPLDWIVEDLSELTDVQLLVSPGPFWEHIDFNHDDPLLGQDWVRESLASAIDRESILDSTVRQVYPLAQPLDNSVYVSNSLNYEDHYQITFSLMRAEQILVDHGCVRGDDDVYVCGGQRMSFAWATTIGDDFRAAQAEIVADDLATIGVELIVDYRTPSDLFDADVFFAGPEVWQIINFSWKTAADPYLSNSTYFCEGSAASGFGALNVNRYCNPDVGGLIRSTNLMPDEDVRAATYNEADDVYLSDLAIVPLYQKPVLLAWSSELSGPETNISGSNVMWNVGAWTGVETVRYGLGTEPTTLDPTSSFDDDTAVIMSALTSGAFGTTPSLEFAPVLIESAETFVRAP